MRDLLGLSTSESWKSYDDTVKKTEAKLVDGKYKKIEKESELNIARIKSPITFKLLKTSIGYDVLLFLDKSINELIQTKVLGKTFIIEGLKTDAEEPDFEISFPPSFSYKGFFDYILGDTFDIGCHVENEFQKREEFCIIKKIFSQLKENYNCP
jgi:hypothetical protein